MTLELDPNHADAHAAIGWIKYLYDWDWPGAEAAYKRALELEPSNWWAIRGAANLVGVLGRVDEGTALARQAIQLDPLQAIAYRNLGALYYFAGRWKEAEAAFHKALELNPQLPFVHERLIRIYLAQSKTEAALAEIQKEPDRGWRLFEEALVYHAAGKKKEADAALAEYKQEFQNVAPYQIAEIYAYRGEINKAFEWLDRAYQKREWGLTLIKGDTLLRNLHGDPRWPAFLAKMKLPL